MRDSVEIEARRDDLNDKLNALLTGAERAADPQAAIAGLATRMHELDWVLGRNEG